MRPSILNNLLSPIGILKGVGPKLEKVINKLGISLNVHFLWHFPYNVIEKKFYENVTNAPLNSMISIKIRVIKHYPSRFKRQPYKVACISGEIPIDIVFFNARHPVIRNILPDNSTKLISGKLEFFKNKFQITHPSNISDISKLEQIEEKELVYGLTAGLNKKTLLKISGQILESLPILNEWINKDLIQKYKFSNWKESINGIHNPNLSDNKLLKEKYRRRLAYDELLSHQLAIAIMRRFNLRKQSTNFKTENLLTHKFINNLNFNLTNSQIKVLDEIKNDLFSDKQMLRLIQGDVGSGKTIVALISMIRVVEKKFQTV